MPRDTSMAVHVDGLRPLLRQLSKAPRELQNKIRDASQRIADRIASQAASQASGQGGQAAGVAGSIKAKRDRIPVVQAGGSGAFPTSHPHRVRMEDVFFGAEFGGRGRPTTQQFRPHRGRTGYFLYPTIRSMRSEITQEWLDAVGDVIDEVEHGA